MSVRNVTSRCMHARKLVQSSQTEMMCCKRAAHTRLRVWAGCAYDGVFTEASKEPPPALVPVNVLAQHPPVLNARRGSVSQDCMIARQHKWSMATATRLFGGSKTAITWPLAARRCFEPHGFHATGNNTLERLLFGRKSTCSRVFSRSDGYMSSCSTT